MNIGIMMTGRDKKNIAQKLMSYDKAVKKLKYPMVISEKFDGVFAMARQNDEGEVVIFSRTGEPYVSVRHLYPFLEKFFKVKPDGKSKTVEIVMELIVPCEPQSVLSGAVRDTKEQHPEVVAMIVGLVDENQMIHFGSGKGNEYIITNTPYKMIPHMIINNEDELNQIYDAVIEAGGEGVVLSPGMVQKYDYGKRNATLVKRKSEITYDLEVVNVQQGKKGTKYENTLGALVCRFRDGVEVSVSGMTDSDRDYWWKYPTTIIGRIIEVRAMAESSKGSLREPRYKGIRHDKEVGDF